MWAKRFHLPLLIVVALLFTFLMYGSFLRFNITPEQPWRQSDSLAEIKAYADDATNFSHPLVNAPETKWGPDFLEIGFPIFQYTAAKLSKLIAPIVRPFLAEHTRGPVLLPYGLKFGSYQESKRIEGDKVIYTLDFILRPTFEYRLAALAEPLQSLTHVYFVAKQPIGVKRQCIGLSIQQPGNFGGPSKYCYSQSEVPIVYLHIGVGRNLLVFSFDKKDAPKTLSSAVSLFGDQRYATPELLAGRILDILTVAAIAVLLSIAFFPRGIFRFFSILSICSLPIFGLFATFIHEEIQAFLFVSIFICIIMRKRLVPFWLILATISLSIAVAIRPYYVLYMLLPAAFAFYYKKMRALRVHLYYVCCVLVLVPAIFWYAWTRYWVLARGADTVGIFSDRVSFKSMLVGAHWDSLMRMMISLHFGIIVFWLFILIYLVFIVLCVKKKIHFNEKLDIFLASGLIIAIVIFPLIFDSGAIHDYYSFPVTSYMIMAGLICFYRITLVIKSEISRERVMLVICGIIILNGMMLTYVRLARNVKAMYDPLDFAVMGMVTSQLFSFHEKLVLLGAGGPQVYGITGRYGRRDTGYYTGYHFSGVPDLKRYLVNEYGEIDTYAGISTCQTILHWPPNFKIYQDFLKSEVNSKTILYYLETYPNCYIMRFHPWQG